jgi:hypothetical protein
MTVPAPACREAVTTSGGWLNRTTAGIPLASLMWDASHELPLALFARVTFIRKEATP